MLDSLQIKNLKSIKELKDFVVKPLTIIIGKNSSGKSSLLRVFPLLKQSYLVNVSEPILWYGNYVDFGSFKNTITSGCDIKSDKIELTFAFTHIKKRYQQDDLYKSVTIRFSIGEHSIHEYEIIVDDLNSFLFKKINNDSYNLFVNGEKIDGVLYKQNDLSGKKLPVDSYYSNRYYFYYPIEAIPVNFIKKYSSEEKPLKKLINDEVTIVLSLDRISLASAKTDAIDLINKCFKPRINPDETDVANVAINLIRNTVNEVINELEDVLQDTFTNVQYFQPIRSRGDRLYRVQGLNTKEIDSDGNNSPMFLYNLKEQQRAKFEAWCMENFGFTYLVSLFSDGSESTSIKIKTNSGDEHNLTDVGFGYSQIFPIILSLWNDIQNPRRIIHSQRIVVIEQPELHLHPAFQKKLMNAILRIIELSKEKGADFDFIIETHSESIINYIGKRINEGSVNKDSINLLMCEKNENNYSIFTKMVFDNQGLIENWPDGFFSEED